MNCNPLQPNQDTIWISGNKILLDLHRVSAKLIEQQPTSSFDLNTYLIRCWGREMFSSQSWPCLIEFVVRSCQQLAAMVPQNIATYSTWLSNTALCHLKRPLHHNHNEQRYTKEVLEAEHLTSYTAWAGLTFTGKNSQVFGSAYRNPFGEKETQDRGLHTTAF